MGRLAWIVAGPTAMLRTMAAIAVLILLGGLSLMGFVTASVFELKGRNLVDWRVAFPARLERRCSFSSDSQNLPPR